jgi:hypothetical protein
VRSHDANAQQASRRVASYLARRSHVAAVLAPMRAGGSHMSQQFDDMIRGQSSTPAVEDRTTRSVEQQTAKIPSLGFLGLAGGAIVASAALMFMGKKAAANFVGQWAPTILIMGIYNKLVKVENELASGSFTPGMR